MLNQDPRRFSELGYCVFPGVLSASETLAARRLLDEALTHPLPLPRDPNMYLVNRPDYIGEPHARDRRWLELCRHPRLLDAVEAVLGPNLILVFSSVFVKPAHNDVVVAWHQDANFWPAVHGTDVVTVWLAIDDADRENAALQLVPGSHNGYVEFGTVPSGNNEFLEKKVVLTAEQNEKRVTLEMKAGSLSIHHTYILHGSDANHSKRRRAGYTIRYCSTDTSWVETARHPIPVYLVRGLSGTSGQPYVDLRPEVPMDSVDLEALRPGS